MAKFIGTLVPIALLFGALGAALVVPWICRRITRDRRSPLTQGLLRGPGESLRHQIEDLETDVAAYLATAVSLPLLAYAIFTSQALWSGTGWSPSTTALLVIVSVGAFGFVVVKLVRVIQEKRRLQMAFDCEVAVGQELDCLMRDGCYVFHDVQGRNFNIDHVVVGKSGIFAVETKGRSKRRSGPGGSNGRETFGYKVIYDGKKLHFPHTVQSDPIRQARRQALWLSRWVKRMLGESVYVQPVVALPGWFVERSQKPNGVVVLSGKECHSLAEMNGNHPLPESLVKSIAQKLDAVCRNVQPRAYCRRPGVP